MRKYSAKCSQGDPGKPLLSQQYELNSSGPGVKSGDLALIKGLQGPTCPSANSLESTSKSRKSDCSQKMRMMR